MAYFWWWTPVFGFFILDICVWFWLLFNHYLMSVIHYIWNPSLVEQSSHKYGWCSRFSVLHYTCEYKSSRALPSYVIIQPLVIFKAINVCYTNSHMQLQTSYFCLSFWQTHLRYSLVFSKLTWFVGKLLLIVRKIFFCFFVFVVVLAKKWGRESLLKTPFTTEVVITLPLMVSRRGCFIY